MPGLRLSRQERLVIERGLDGGLGQGQIARVLGRDPGTVSREVRRNGGKRSARPGARLCGRPRRYQADRADRMATERARRPKPAKVVGRLAAVVTALLEADWSPQQIAALLPRMYPDDQAMQVSHETIYRSLFVQTRGQLRRDLTVHLRTGRTDRKRQGKRDGRGRIVGMIPISARPAEADDRAVPGHWEGDLLMGGVGKGAVITLVERTSRFVMLAPLPSGPRHRDTPDAHQMISRLPDQLRRSLAWDQGSEMASTPGSPSTPGCRSTSVIRTRPGNAAATRTPTVCCASTGPRAQTCATSPSTDATPSPKLNTRPRQTLEWKTPAQALDEALLATTH